MSTHEPTYAITNEYISTVPNTMTEAEFRAYIAENVKELGWDLDESTIYVELGVGIYIELDDVSTLVAEAVMIVEPLRPEEHAKAELLRRIAAGETTRAALGADEPTRTRINHEHMLTDMVRRGIITETRGKHGKITYSVAAS